MLTVIFKDDSEMTLFERGDKVEVTKDRTYSSSDFRMHRKGSIGIINTCGLYRENPVIAFHSVGCEDGWNDVSVSTDALKPLCEPRIVLTHEEYDKSEISYNKEGMLVVTKRVSA